MQRLGLLVHNPTTDPAVSLDLSPHLPQDQRVWEGRGGARLFAQSLFRWVTLGQGGSWGLGKGPG